MSPIQTNPEHMQVLKIRKGTELYVHASSDIGDPSSYMNQSYRQAMRALVSIVRQSRDFCRDIERYCSFCLRDPNSQTINDDYLDEKLFSYSSNVIGFSGERGYGKTRTMLSFAHILKKELGSHYHSLEHKQWDYLAGFSDDDCKMLENTRFIVIPPISPSVLEEKQNILHVILTKLYHHAEELIKKQNHYSQIQGQEEWRYKLHQTFQYCYSGINGIKHSPKTESGDLMELQDLDDGLELRRHFYDLVQQLLSYYGKQDVYLVLQLDDADSQIKNGFEVMEDVRKYLQIPNLIILMSADMDMMHDVIRQDHQRQFPDRKDDEVLQKKLTRICRKYIDKLIPPSYMIYLPALDQSIHHYSDIKLKYVDKDEKPVFPWAEQEGMDLQDMLLMLIYRKTGIVFTRHTGYVHNIIPTTIRGLNHFLHMLSKMQDIPAVESKAENFANTGNLTDAILEQVGIQDENLNRFSNYFNGDWVRVKIVHSGDREFLNELANKPGHMYVQYVVDYLFERYANSRTIEKWRKNNWNCRSQVDLDYLMMDLTQEHTKQEDYYLLFAIQTIFTLNHHKMILRQKRRAVKNFRAIKENPPVYFAIDFDPAETGLSKTYPVNEEFLSVSLGKPKQLADIVATLRDAEQRVERTKRKADRTKNHEVQANRKQYEAEILLTELKQQKINADSTLKIAQKDLVSKVKSAEQAASKLKVLESELPANMVSILGNETMRDKIVTSADTAKQIAHAKVLKEQREEAAQRANEKVDEANRVLAELEKRIRANQIEQFDLQIETEKLAEEAKQAEDAVREANKNLFLTNQRVEEWMLAIDSNCDAVPERVFVRPVFKVTSWLNKCWKEQLSAQSKEPTNTIAKKTVKEPRKNLLRDNILDGPAIQMKQFLLNCMVTKDIEDNDSVNFMSFITFLLRLGYPGVIGQNQGENVDATQFQRQLYLIQECALTIAANWDVQEAIYKKMTLKGQTQIRADMHQQEIQKAEPFKNLYRAIDHVLKSKINHGRLYAYRQECFSAGQDKAQGDIETEWSIAKGFDLFELFGKYTLLPPIDRMTFYKQTIFNIDEKELPSYNLKPVDHSKPSFTPDML